MATYIVDEFGFREVPHDEPLIGNFRLYMEGSDPVTSEMARIWVPGDISDASAQKLLGDWKSQLEASGERMPDFSRYHMGPPK